uniref:Vacuolar protein sorting-associated protein 25 n=1 Tax=Cajanus cajan TaxID=3821 RepID=A0A151RQN5_CAJCA|nr:Vacuolar protein sorting-associated protein 25 [Cajanus cajan]
MQKLGDFKLPHFFNYPPYFTLLVILYYCCVIQLFFLFCLQSSLLRRAAFLSGLVSERRAEWMDKGHRKCLILWHRIQNWADILIQFAKDNGLEDGVVTIEEIRSGTESQGTVYSSWVTSYLCVSNQFLSCPVWEVNHTEPSKAISMTVIH